METLLRRLAEQCCKLEHEDGKWGRPVPCAYFNRSRAEQLINNYIEDHAPRAETEL